VSVIQESGTWQWRLEWIPRSLKENVKVVLSVSDEDLLLALKRNVVCSAINFIDVRHPYHHHHHHRRHFYSPIKLIETHTYS